MAFGLCILSRLFHLLLADEPAWADAEREGAFEVPTYLSATGHLRTDGTFESIAGRSIDAKLQAVLRGTPEPERAETILLATDALPSVPRGLRVHRVQNLRRRRALPFPGCRRHPTISTRRSKRSPASWTAKTATMPILCSSGSRANPRFTAGMKFCENDPVTFVLASCYLAFCAEHLRLLARAPKTGPRIRTIR